MSKQTAISVEPHARIANKRDYKAAIATLPQPQGARQRTTAEIINRLNPQERHEIQRLLRSMTLRKTIRRVLYESFHRLNEPHLMRELRQSVARVQSFEPVITEAPKIVVP